MLLISNNNIIESTFEVNSFYTHYSNYNKNDEKVKANDHIHQDVPLYEQVSLDKEVLSTVANSAYGIQQRKIL